MLRQKPPRSRMISVLNERHSEHSICSDHMHRLATYTVLYSIFTCTRTCTKHIFSIFSIELYTQNCAHSIRMQAMQQQRAAQLRKASVRCPSITARCACLCVFTSSLSVRKVHIVRQAVDSNTFTRTRVVPRQSRAFGRRRLRATGVRVSESVRVRSRSRNARSDAQ